MSIRYERELVHILEGNTKTIKTVSRTMDMLQKDKMNKIINRPFLVLRAAGSMGVDIAAIRGDIALPIEVKSSKYNKIILNTPKLKEQANRMINTCKKTGLIPIYAFRLKNIQGDSWRFFTLPIEELTGRNQILYKRLPQVELTPSGNFKLEWIKGMPLSDLADYLDYI